MGKVGKVLIREIREAIPPMLFFVFLFHLIALTKAVVQDTYSFTAFREVSASIGALVVAKAILIVEALPMSRKFSGRLAVKVLWKTVLYSIMILFIRLLEDYIPLISKHGGLVSAAKALYSETSWPLFIIVELWIFAGLLLYCTISELVRLAGPDRVKEVFFGIRKSSDG